MKVQPLIEYKVPKYPDKLVVHFNPNLLKTMPERWKGNVLIGVALSSLTMMMFTACGRTQPQNTDNRGQTQSLSTDNNGTSVNTGGESEFVAPLFVHGDGRGSFGCESVAPPAFLSEEEAFQVVQEEARKLNLEFQKDGETFKNVGIPVTDILSDFSSKNGEDGASKLLNIRNGELQLDGYDEKNHIGFEFVSRDDFVGWNKQKNIASTVESYDLIPAAETLRKGLGDNTEGNTVGVFYEPMIFSESINKKYNDKIDELRNNEKLTEEQLNSEGRMLYENYMMELKQSAQEQLREQVKDFLDWLKAEGII